MHPSAIQKIKRESISITTDAGPSVPLSVDFETTLNDLLQIEKHSANNSDLSRNSSVMQEIVQLCVDNRKWPRLREVVFILAKKLTAMKPSIQKLVRECMRHVDRVENAQERTRVLEDLRFVTDGKIYLEKERAELSEMLADGKEAEGDLQEAARIMAELKIETFGTLDMREKVEYLLHQMRLYVLTEQNDLALVLSKKIHTKFLNEPKNEDLKKLFFEMKILLEKRTQYLSTCRYFLELLTIPSITEQERTDFLVNAAIFCILAPLDEGKTEILTNLLKNNNLKENSEPFWKMLECFASKELIHFNDFSREFNKDLHTVPMLDQNTNLGQEYWREMKKRLIEHNIYTVSRYYNRILLKRLSELLNIAEPVCEEFLSEMVGSKGLVAKIDRFTGIVEFSNKKTAEERLDDWSAGIHALTKRVNQVGHEINKEFCVQGV